MTKKSSAKSAKKKKAASSMRPQMESLMRELIESISGQDDIVTQSDLDALLTSLMGPLASDRLSIAQANAKDEAQELAFDAMEAESTAQARKLAKRALQLDPDCVDALVAMTDLDARTPRETIEGLQKAVAAGERSLGEQFIRENKGHFWMLIETRPWMRAMKQLAAVLHAQGILLDAARVYEKMLDLNPNDNQGIRDPLLSLYLETGNLEGAGRILKKYRNDASTNFAWSRVLERLLAGDRDGAATALTKARKANPHVETYQTGRKSLPKHQPEMYSPGSEEEAVLCINNLSGAWARHKEATCWLFDQFMAAGLQMVPHKETLKKVPVSGKTVQ